MLSTITKNLKVLHLTTGNQTRGIADYTRDIQAALAGYGIKQDTFFLDGDHQQKLANCCEKAKMAALVHIQHEFAFFSKQSWQHSIDIFQQFLQSFYLLKKPVVVTFHTEADFFNTQDGNKTGRSLANAREYWRNKISPFFNDNNHFHAIVHTHKTRLALINAGILADKITVMPLGITPRDNLALINSQQAKQILSYPENSIILSIFGFITKNKGHEFAIKALKLLPKNYYLAIIGGNHPDGKNSNMKKISTLASTNTDFRERIRITGYVDQKAADLYHAATDICLAPYHGNMSGSGAIGWALSSGKPIIASNTPTFVEINQQTECFLMCKEKSVSALAKQIKHLIANTCLQTALVKNALNYVACHSWQEVVKKIIMCYEKCLMVYD